MTDTLDPNRRELFTPFARNWEECRPRCGADLIGSFAPHEGSTSTASGICARSSRAGYEADQADLGADPRGRETGDFAKRQDVFRCENRLFVKRPSSPHRARA